MSSPRKSSRLTAIKSIHDEVDMAILKAARKGLFVVSVPTYESDKRSEIIAEYLKDDDYTVKVFNENVFIHWD